MTISDNIKHLTDLALKDRVLTYKERQVIVEAAVKEGVAKEQIDAYLDNALHERLQSYSKEDLRRCPHCGAQIPLISDVCLFCGESLNAYNAQDTVQPPPHISGKDAQIIQAENVRTAAEQHNIKTCPDCGAPFPLVSNVCTHCGHILHEQQESDFNVKNLISNIQQSIDELKSAPQPSFWNVLWYRKNYWMFLVSFMLLLNVVRFVLRYIENGYLVLGMAIASLVLLLAAIDITQKTKKDPPSKMADDKFFAALHRKEMYENQIATIYGDNAEAKEVLRQYSSLTDSITTQRRSRQIKLALTVCAFFVATLFIVFDTYSNKEIFQIEQKKFNYAYALLDKTFPVQPADTIFCKEYLLMEGEADLSFDMKFDKFISRTFIDEIDFHVRVSNVTLKSSGEPYIPRTDEYICLVLYDENFEFVFPEYDPLILSINYESGFYENLKNGKGKVCADFVSRYAQTLPPDKETIQMLEQRAQKAKYYSIYLTQIEP